MDILTLLSSLLVGFIAQIIDGALGMAYGVTSTTALLSIGFLPAVASASVHTAEVFTTLTSGVSHLRLGNVDLDIFKRLLIPGVLSGALGAYVCVAMPSGPLKIGVSFYLLAMGVVILAGARSKNLGSSRGIGKGKLPFLGAAGGFFDAIGGGGWGPIVTSTLVARGHRPHLAVGSVNLAEFFVTVAETVTFFTFLGLWHFDVILGLLIGGVIAAPLAAYACRKLPPRVLMAMVGVVIVVLSLRNVYSALV